VLQTEFDTLVVVDHETKVALDLVIAEKFSNGFRITSDIELIRLRKSVNELLNKEIVLTNEDIIRYIEEHGMEFDGKIYFITIETKIKIVELA